MNLTLAEAIVRSANPRDFAQRVGMDVDTLSLIVQDVRDPTWFQRRRMAKALGLPAPVLFHQATHVESWWH